MKEKISAALIAAGYDGAPSRVNLVSCFLDYAAAGYWCNLSYDDAKELIDSELLSIDDMIAALSEV